MLDSRGSILGKPGSQDPFMPVAGADKQGEYGDAPSSGLRQASTEAGCHGKLPLDCSTDRSGGGGRWSSAGHGQGGGARGDSNSNRGFCRGSGGRAAMDGGNVSVVTMFGMSGVGFPDRRRASIGRFDRFRCQSLAVSRGRESRDHSGSRWAGGRAVGSGATRCLTTTFAGGPEFGKRFGRGVEDG